MKNLSIELLQEADLEASETLLKLAFGTFLKLSDPLKFGGGAVYWPRWYRDPSSAFAAKIDNQLIGYSLSANWGTYGGFGPLIVHPNYWDQGIGSRLMMASLEKIEDWKIKQLIFCTHANSPKHIYFYGKFGLSPRFLIAVFAQNKLPNNPELNAFRYSQLSPEQQTESLQDCYQLTDKIYEGLDFRAEIKNVQTCSLGDTIFLWDEAGLFAFAVCHYGETSEAQTNTCYLKFAAVRPDNQAKENFEKLLDESEKIAVIEGMSSLIFGIDTACENAYRQTLARKYQIQSLMLSLHKPNQSGHSRPEIYIIEDRR